MFNTRQVLNAETQHAEYYAYDDATKTFAPKVKFMYKTYDDTQYREARIQMQPGNLSSKFTLSIKTSAPIDFKVKDKIVLLYDGRTYEVTGIQTLQNTNHLVSMIMPSSKGQYAKLIHLNKDGVG
jgi:hypothetical protein